MARPLASVRDFFDYAVGEFSRAGLAFGQGATNAADEAAFMVLEGLGLPIDDINSRLDKKVSPAERGRLIALIEARVRTRTPAAYLLHRAYIQGVPFYVDERVIIPRSYIGELLASGVLETLLPDEVSSVLDLCTGSGCLAILAAQAFPDAAIHACDLSSDALAVARRNIAQHGLVARVTLHEGDLFAPLGDRRFDLIIANPPYVDAKAMAAFPDEFRAEPPMAHAGGADGLDIVRRIIDDAPARLTRFGGLLCEIGRGRALLEAERPELSFMWLDTEESACETFWLPASAFEA
jgi:ribosomal protein L3 glutamine methyltransferase